MNNIEEIKRIQEALQLLQIDKTLKQCIDIWNLFCYEGSAKEWLPVTEQGLQIFKEYINKTNTITIEEVIELDEPFLYFLLWLLKVHRGE